MDNKKIEYNHIKNRKILNDELNTVETGERESLIEEKQNLIEGYDDKGEKNWRGKTRN